MTEKTSWLPRLYKKSNTGKIIQWRIGTLANTIITEWGQIGGRIQRVEDIVKNTRSGRSVEEQALVEAERAWKKAVDDDCYVEDIKRAEKDQDDTGRKYWPMLAANFEDNIDRVKYPVLVQPKIDGLRCIAEIRNGTVKLWSRGGKPITSAPHIIDALKNARIGNMEEVILDGELWSAKLGFEKGTGAMRRKSGDAETAQIDYHVFDMWEVKIAFEKRFKIARQIVESIDSPSVKMVKCYWAEDEDAVRKMCGKFESDGYEGAIVRSPRSLYEQKRTRSLLKLKSFHDAEFKVIGAEEGRGKYQGCVGAWVCVTKDGTEFRAKQEGTIDQAREMWQIKKRMINRMMTVRYQNLTSSGVPRFPVAVRFREKGE